MALRAYERPRPYHPSVMIIELWPKQGIANTELQFEMAMRDQIIHNQREAHKNLWNLLLSLGLDEKQIFGLAEKQGITIEDSISTPQSGLTTRKQSSNLGCGRYSPSSCSSHSGFPSVTSSAFPQEQEQGSRTCSKENWRLPHSYIKEEHHGPDGCPPPHLQNPYPHMRTSASPYDDGHQKVFFRQPLMSLSLNFQFLFLQCFSHLTLDLILLTGFVDKFIQATNTAKSLCWSQ